MHIGYRKKWALVLSGAKNQIKGVYLTTPRLQHHLKNIRGATGEGPGKDPGKGAAGSRGETMEKKKKRKLVSLSFFFMKCCLFIGG